MNEEQTLFIIRYESDAYTLNPIFPEPHSTVQLWCSSPSFDMPTTNHPQAELFLLFFVTGRNQTQLPATASLNAICILIATFTCPSCHFNMQGATACA